MIPLSVLDLSPILAGSDAAQSFRNSERISNGMCGVLVAECVCFSKL